MEALKLETYTSDDIKAMPEGTRVELLDGVLYDMASPTTVHQRLTFQLSFAIESHIRAKKGKCEVIPAPYGVFLDKKNFLEPDISVICDTDKIKKDGCHGAPDWVIEVVSPSSQVMDYLRKLKKYIAFGVREYWIVDPQDETVTTYDLENDNMAKYTFHDEIACQLFPGLKLEIDKLGRW